MGNEYGDAQNSAVRVFLYQFSKKFDTFFNNYYKQKTLAYFDNKCPYSGVDISNIKTDNDHIVPFNKEYCGLHIYGNILIVTKEANAKKHNQTLENFLNDNPERLEKIQNFMQESLFKSIYETYNEQLKFNCKSLYDDVRVLIEKRFTNFTNTIKLPVVNKRIHQKIVLNNNSYNVINNSRITTPIKSYDNGNNNDDDKIHLEIKKVQNRIPKWFQNKSQVNSKLLYAFIRIYEKSGVVTVEELEKEANIKKFTGNYNQMKNFGQKNHGKIFEEENGSVFFWKEVAEIIWNYYNKNVKNI